MTTPEAPTFNRGDYLAIGPLCWARTTEAARALKLCKMNAPVPKKQREKLHYKVFQLADQVDRTEVNELGVRFFHKGTDSQIPQELIPTYAILVDELNKPEN